MDWFASVRKQAQAAVNTVVNSEAAELARQLAAQATEQATALAKEATVKAQVCPRAAAAARMVCLQAYRKVQQLKVAASACAACCFLRKREQKCPHCVLH
jgi:hypothetical protein